MPRKAKPKTSDELFPSLKGQGHILLDCETKDPELKEKGCGAHKDDTHIAGIAIGTAAGYKEYYPIGHENAAENMDPDKVRRWLKHELADAKVPKLGANLLYDSQFLESEGVPIAGLLYDIQIAEPLLCETRFNYSLESIAQVYLKEGKVDYELDKYLIEKYGKKNPKQNIWRAPVELVRPYALGDIDLPMRIFEKQKAQLEKEDLWDLFIMETKLIPMLAAMRKIGVAVDLKKAEAMDKRYAKEQADIEDEIERVCGLRVDIWAAGSIATAFDAMGVAYPLTPKTKKPSFTALFLENSEAPIAKMLVEARRMDKMRGTFLQGSIMNAHYNGRIHCNFNQLKGESGGAVSGRFSSSQPNLQFIPTRTEEGKLIRKMFLPDKGKHWYKLDYSQIEYRLLVHDAAQLNLRGGREVADRYWKDSGVDFHSIVAEMTGLSRSAAKTVNFGIAYGEGKHKLAAGLGLSLDDAEALLREYHRRAPFMKPLSNVAMNQANRGVVETLMGRKRRFDAWQVYDRKTKESKILPHRVPGATRAFTHKALNARTQGSAADVMKAAMVSAWESGVYDEIGSVSQLTVHDELDGSFEPTKRGMAAVKELQNIMENVVKLEVPLKVDLSTGKNWGEAA